MSGRLDRVLRALRQSTPALVGLGLVALLATPALSPSTGALSSDDTDGLSTFQTTAKETGYEVRTSAIDPAQATGFAEERTLVIVSEASARVLPPTASAMQRWSSQGGGLWIADGEGGAQPLLEALDVPVTPRRVLEADVSGDPTLVRADLVLDPAGAGSADDGETDTFRVTLRQPFAIDASALEDGPWQATTETLGSSFVDIDGNGQLDDADPRGPFVVGVSGEGRVVAFTSGHLLSNEALLEEQAAQAVRQQVGRLLPEGGDVVVDTSHADHGIAGEAALVILRPVVGVTGSLVWGTLAALATAGGIGWWLYQRSRGPEDWAEGRLDPWQVQGDDPSPDVTFMSRVLESMAGSSEDGAVPERYREFRDRIRQAEATKGNEEP